MADLQIYLLYCRFMMHLNRRKMALPAEARSEEANELLWQSVIEIAKKTFY